ncbi:MAG: hypothetical protein JNM69_10190 [Archangium sp.]|nr:hypothetical protein [Archangium sp.]
MNALMTVAQASALISSGRPVLIAGDEKLLRALPRGRWIGGSIPYFMADAGGTKTADRLFVTQLPEFAKEAEARLYDVATLPRLPEHYPDNGVSFVILPASSKAHVEFAEHGTSWPGVFDRPLVGWIAGVDLADLGKVSPKVFDGSTGAESDNAAAVLHVKLPSSHHANIDIINLFEQGRGDELTFFESGFQVDECLVNGARRNFAEYLIEKQIDTKLPLVADYHGAMVNISFQNVDAKTRKVSLYAPVFEGVSYRVAAPLAGDYAAEFQKQLAARNVKPVFACNCILNFLYGALEGRTTGSMVGPVTFGEIAYMLLNQTMVYVDFVKR